MEFSLQLGPEVAEVLLVKSVSQAQVEGKEESKKEAVSAQSGHHPEHCQQLHAHGVAQVREESQSSGRLQGQGLTQPQHVVVHLFEAHEFCVVKDEKDAEDEEPGNDVEHKAEEGHPGGPWLGLSLPQYRAPGYRLPVPHHQLKKDEGVGIRAAYS